VLDPLPNNLYEGSIGGTNRRDSDPPINPHTAPRCQPPQQALLSPALSNGARTPSPDKPRLPRARSDFGPRKERQHSADDAGKSSAHSPPSDDARSRMRHGWEAQLQSDEQANILSQVRPARSASTRAFAALC